MKGQIIKVEDNILQEIFMPANYCLLIEIFRRRNDWNRTIFEFKLVSLSRVVEDICLVNCDACEFSSVDLSGGHLMRSAEVCS